MVTHATSNPSVSSGLRPVNSIRDVASVTQLIEQAFAEDMDARGHATMREMRWAGTVFGWADWFASPGQGLMPGYVWVESGHIVGNATVRRLSAFGTGWMIGNVAVAPAWRGHGIGRQLMEASIDLVRHNHGDWIALQVRSDNEVASGLYHSLGFVDTGEIVYFESSQPDPVSPPSLVKDVRLRPALDRDMGQLYTLAQARVPESVRWAEPVYRSTFDLSVERHLTDWITATGHVWRVAEVGDQIWGAAMLQVKPREQRAQLFLWVVPAHTDRVEQALVDSVLAEVHTPLRQITARVPGDHIAGRVAFTTRGFRQVRALTSMKLALNNS